LTTVSGTTEVGDVVAAIAIAIAGLLRRVKERGEENEVMQKDGWRKE
jgi:hypothetical protein